MITIYSYMCVWEEQQHTISLLFVILPKGIMTFLYVRNEQPFMYVF